MHPFILKSANFYASRLPKRKDLVQFGISLICHIAQDQSNRKILVKTADSGVVVIVISVIIVFLTCMGYGWSSGRRKMSNILQIKE